MLIKLLVFLATAREIKKVERRRENIASHLDANKVYEKNPIISPFPLNVISLLHAQEILLDASGFNEKKVTSCLTKKCKIFFCFFCIFVFFPFLMLSDRSLRIAGSKSNLVVPLFLRDYNSNCNCVFLDFFLSWKKQTRQLVGIETA